MTAQATETRASDQPAPRKFTEADARALLARLIAPASPGMRSLAQLLEGR